MLLDAWYRGGSRLCLIVAASFWLCTSGALAEETDCSLEGTDRAEITAALQCLIDELKIAKRHTIPSGAVLAFDRSSGCPTGWTEFKEAAGKVVIGVGSGILDIPQGDDQRLTKRIYREQGGAEQHTLTPDEMPGHTHPALFGMSDDLGNDEMYIKSNNGTDNPRFRTGSNTNNRFTIKSITTIKTAGGSLPHNNMPPYISLYFCKKVN
ncbi:MAG: hypothetical protein KDC18_06965 [Alphaproteobacteria bacterium]|nr:hypothetical protein [Alphaproteobacteria bacterium]